VEGKFEEAAVLAGKSLEIHQAQLGPNHPSVAGHAGRGGLDSTRLGHYQQAESAYVQSLAIREKAKTPDQLGVAATLNDLGFRSIRWGITRKQKYPTAGAGRYGMRLLGSNHPDLCR